jgi:hypothetical protein
MLDARQTGLQRSPSGMKKHAPTHSTSSADSPAFSLARTHTAHPTYQPFSPPTAPLPGIPASKGYASSYSTADFYSVTSRTREGSISSTVPRSSMDSGKSYSSQKQLQDIIASQFPSPPPSSFGMSPRSSAQFSMAYATPTPYALPKSSFPNFASSSASRRSSSPAPSLISPTQSSTASSLPVTPQANYTTSLHPHDLCTPTASNWPPFGRQPSSRSSGASFVFPASAKPPAKDVPKKARVVGKPGSSSFLDIDDSEDEVVKRSPGRTKVPSTRSASTASGAVYRDVSLDVPVDVRPSSMFGGSRYGSRKRSQASIFPSFQPPSLTVGDDPVTIQAAYNSFSQASFQAPSKPTPHAYAYADVREPYHASLRETQGAKIDAYRQKVYAPANPYAPANAYGNSLLSPAPSAMSFLETESAGTAKAPSFMSDHRSFKSHVSGKALKGKVKSWFLPKSKT